MNIRRELAPNQGIERRVLEELFSRLQPHAADPVARSILKGLPRALSFIDEGKADYVVVLSELERSLAKLQDASDSKAGTILRGAVEHLKTIRGREVFTEVAFQGAVIPKEDVTRELEELGLAQVTDEVKGYRETLVRACDDAIYLSKRDAGLSVDEVLEECERHGLTGRPLPGVAVAARSVLEKLGLSTASSSTTPSALVGACFDGVGGAVGGRAAAELAVLGLRLALRRDTELQPRVLTEAKERLREKLNLLNTLVFETARQTPASARTGDRYAFQTTASIFELIPAERGASSETQKLIYIAIGDSPLYVYRRSSGLLEKLTRTQQAFLGAEATLTDAEVQEGEAEVGKGDIVFSTSDGLGKYLDDQDLAVLIGRACREGKKIVDVLLDPANYLTANTPVRAWSYQNGFDGRERKPSASIEQDDKCLAVLEVESDDVFIQLLKERDESVFQERLAGIDPARVSYWRALPPLRLEQEWIVAKLFYRFKTSPHKTLEAIARLADRSVKQALICFEDWYNKEGVALTGSEKQGVDSIQSKLQELLTKATPRRK